jgi:DNA repair protein RAD16
VQPTPESSITVALDGSDSDFPELSRIGTYTETGKTTKDAAGPEALSSDATSHDYNESSGYSSPATSAFVTPAPAKSSPTTRALPSRRGRRPVAAAVASPAAAVSAVMRAAALRNSQYSLNPASIKRKREVISGSDNDDDDIDADEDNSPDAQLARALQEQEDAVAASMGSGDHKTRRSPRNLKEILPKFYELSDMSLSDDDGSFAPAAKRPKVVLSSHGLNSISFSSNKAMPRWKSNIVMDSEDSDEFVDIDDSEDDEPIARTAARSRMRQVIADQSKAFKLEKPGPWRPHMLPPPRPSASALSSSKPIGLSREDTRVSSTSSALSSLATPLLTESEFDSELGEIYSDESDFDDSSDDGNNAPPVVGGPRSQRAARQRLNIMEERHNGRARVERARLEAHHPELHTMWQDLENLPKIGSAKIEQPANISRELKPFQLEGVAWMKAMEKTDWGGGLLGDEMGMGKTIQAVTLIMSDFPAPQPSIVLIPPVALMQWQQEIADYTDGTLKTFVFHGTNAQTKGVTVKELMKYNVILMSYNSLESMYRKQEKGFKRKNGIYKEKSVIHQIQFHRVILDEAHNIKVETFCSNNSSPANSL